jgi:protein-S-isoprenylcysteine O-methyltransferase Ste14
MNSIKKIIQEVIPLTIVLCLPGYIIATSGTWPTKLIEAFPTSWWDIISPIIYTHLFVIVGHFLMIGQNETNLMQVFVSLSLPIEATVGIPRAIYIGTILNSANPKQNYLFPAQYRNIAQLPSVILFSIGLYLFCTTNYHFMSKGKGTLSPMMPPTLFVVEGPYKFVRNPMLASVLMIVAAEALFFNSKGMAYFTGVFFVCTTLYFMFEEEPKLVERFGEPYKEYCKHVNRWMFRLTPYETSSKAK